MLSCFIRLPKGIERISVPLNKILPSFTSQNLAIRLAAVVFPLPEAPTSARVSPLLTENETFFNNFKTNVNGKYSFLDEALRSANLLTMSLGMNDFLDTNEFLDII